jgi:hypothetical protein
MSRKLSLQDICREVGKNNIYIGQIQTALELHKPEPPQFYSRGYLNFLIKCTALRTFGVALGDMQDLFRKELKILRLLHHDTLSHSPTWYLDACTLDTKDPQRLLLSGASVGFDLQGGPVQDGLDFGTPEPELFDSQQMGESLENVLDLYRRQVAKIRKRVEEERPIIRQALQWSTKAFHLDNA